MLRKTRRCASLLVNTHGQVLMEHELVALTAWAAVTGAKAVATKINAAFPNIGTKFANYTS